MCKYILFETTFIFHLVVIITRFQHNYRISPNKRGGRRGRKQALLLFRFQWNLLGEPRNISTISAENLIQIGSVVSEMWPGKFTSWGCIYLSRRVYLAKYGTHIWLCMRYSKMSLTPDLTVFRAGFYISFSQPFQCFLTHIKALFALASYCLLYSTLLWYLICCFVFVFAVSCVLVYSLYKNKSMSPTNLYFFAFYTLFSLFRSRDPQIL